MSGHEIFSIISGVAVGWTLYDIWIGDDPSVLRCIVCLFPAVGMGHVVYSGFMCGAV